MNLGLYARIALYAALLLGGGFVAWKVQSWRSGAAKVPALTRQLETSKAEAVALRAEAKKIADDRDAAVTAVQQREAADAARILDLQEQARASVAPRPDCDYSESTRVLIERALDGTSAVPAGAEKPDR